MSARTRWAALVAVCLLSPSLVDRAYASSPPAPAHAAAVIAAEKGVLGVRCTRGPVRAGAPTFLCAVKVRSGCVSALFQFRHGEIGWYHSSARPVTCWKVDGGPTS